MHSYLCRAVPFLLLAAWREDGVQLHMGQERQSSCVCIYMVVIRAKMVGLLAGRSS